VTPLLPILGPIEDFFEELYIGIHDVSGLSWAWSIVALTAIVRLLIMPLTVRQTQSMMRMQVLQPYVKELQRKYKDDRQALNEKMMAFYRTNNVNPLASCLPLLLQIPVFTSLFFVLKGFNPPGSDQDLSFLLGFVDDISDHINSSGAAGWILLVFYVVSQMVSSLVMATSPDPRQRLMFMALPLLFVPLIIKFPIGVMLYWITTNFWTFGQYLAVKRLTKLPDVVELPPDDKGRTKTVKRKARPGEKASGASAPKASTGSDPKPPQARQNKRRR
jgi:YidC/Oxa1 family membrane protein insertase